MKKALIFLDYDITIRHFILSGVFNKLGDEYDVTYVFHQDDTSEIKGIYTDINELKLNKWEYFKVPRKRMGDWYWLFIPTMLRKHRNTENYAPVKRQIRMNHTKKMYFVYWLLSLPIVNTIFSAYIKRKIGIFEPLDAYIKENNPDIVFHPSLLAGYFINDLTIICKNRSIPLVVMMNSWDNPSNKAAAADLPTKLVVWGKQTRDHAIRFLGMPEERIEMLGAAQFQVYKEPITETNEELCKIFNVPTGKQILLYAGASKSMNEAGQLKLIDDAIETGELKNCHVLYRPHPWRGRLVDGEMSIFDMELKNVTLDPHMESYYRGILKESNPALYMADYRVTQRLMHLITALVSPLSTILLEAIMHNKPAMAMFVDADPDSAGTKLSEIIKELIYFSEFISSEGILTCDDNSLLVEKCKQLLDMAGQDAIKEKLKIHADKYVEMEGIDYQNSLLNIANQLV